MSTPSPAATLRDLPARRWTRAEYDRLVSLGCFEGERVELIYGVIVEMSPIGNPHNWAVEQLTLLLVPLALSGRARVRIQSSYGASDDSVPEPDVLVSEASESPLDHPGRALLVVEVSETSIDYDRGLKRQLYAEVGAPEYWVVNLEERCVEVFGEPAEGRYLRHTVHGEEATVHPRAFPDVAVPVAQQLLP